MIGISPTYEPIVLTKESIVALRVCLFYPITCSHIFESWLRHCLYRYVYQQSKMLNLL